MRKIMLFLLGFYMGSLTVKGQTPLRFIDDKIYKMGFKLNNQIVIHPRFDLAMEFRQNRALVRINERNGFIDEKGIEVIPVKYDDAGCFHEDLAFVAAGKSPENRKYGYIDVNGKEVIPLIFEEARSFGQGKVSSVKKDGKWMIIDKTGKVIRILDYGYVGQFSNGLARVQNMPDKNKLWGFIDEKGNEVIQTKYEDVYSFVSDKAYVFLNRKTYQIDKKGNLLKEILESIPHASASDNLTILKSEESRLWIGISRGSLKNVEGALEYEIAYMAYQKKDYKLAHKYLNSALKSSHISAMELLAYLYAEGLGVESNHSKAFELYLKAANKGSMDAQFSLGIMIGQGIGKQQDMEKAMEWFKKAAAQGHHESLKIIKDYEHLPEYQKALEIYSKGDLETSFGLFLALAQKKHVNSMHTVGLAYLTESGIAFDEKKGLNWLEEAAIKGNEPSQKILNQYKSGELHYDLGRYYFDNKKYQKANEWYHRGSEIGNSNCMYGVGTIYYEGKGVPVNTKLGLEWFRKSASKGNKYAAEFLRKMENL